MDSIFNYYTFRESFITNKVSKELEFYERHDFKYIYPLDEYIIYLKKRVGIDVYKSKPMCSLYNRTGLGLSTMMIDEHNIDMDTISYQRPWNKLREIHKITKIKEYIDKLIYNKKFDSICIEKNNNKIINELCEGLKMKNFVKGKSSIEYDQDKMIILSISCVTKNKKGIYIVDWDL